VIVIFFVERDLKILYILLKRPWAERCSSLNGLMPLYSILVKLGLSYSAPILCPYHFLISYLLLVAPEM
jgi:hypothetical protein